MGEWRGRTLGRFEKKMTGWQLIEWLTGGQWW